MSDKDVPDDHNSPANIIIAYQKVAQTEEGQIMLQDLVQRFGSSRSTTFVAGDPYATAYNEGLRSVCVHIGAQIDADPGQAELAGRVDSEFEPYEFEVKKEEDDDVFGSD